VVFHILPALTNVLEEEWIPVESFHTASDTWSNQSLTLLVLCTSRKILDLYEESLRQSEKSGQEIVKQFESTQVLYGVE